MINQLHAAFHRPEDGWDPVPAKHAALYAEFAAERTNSVDRVEHWVGSLQGKALLDLGGGPGQCSVEFARRGAHVTWHDVSATYMGIAKSRAQEAGVQVEFSLGYLDHASKLGAARFDIVFNQVCWCYCMSDRPFARMIYDLLRPGGSAYVETDLPSFQPTGTKMRSVRQRIAQNVYSRFGIKIGHPHPPRGHIARLFQEFPLGRIEVDYSNPSVDCVLLKKS